MVTKIVIRDYRNHGIFMAIEKSMSYQKDFYFRNFSVDAWKTDYRAESDRNSLLVSWLFRKFKNRVLVLNEKRIKIMLFSQQHSNLWVDDKKKNELPTKKLLQTFYQSRGNSVAIGENGMLRVDDVQKRSSVELMQIVKCSVQTSLKKFLQLSTSA